MKALLTPLLLLGLATGAPSQQLAEEAHIKALLKGHNRACMDKDAEKAFSYFASFPPVAITYQAIGSGYFRGYDYAKLIRK